MKKIIYATMCIFSLCLGSCEYDDAEVWDAINSQEERIAALEEWRETVNENIAALQAIVNGNDYITSVEELKEGDEIIGYTINFHRQGEVTIYNGKDGEKGDTPVISVTEGEDGRWYWTLNGELMEDADGNPVCASGKDGEDGEDGQDGAPGSSSSGVTPMIKLGKELNEDYNVYNYNHYASYLSVDGGKTWTQINVPLGGWEGSALEAIYDNGSSYYFQFSLGQEYVTGIYIPKYSGSLSFYYHSEAEPEVGYGISNGELSVVAGETFSIEIWKSEGGEWSYNETDFNSDCPWSFERQKDEYDVDYLKCTAPNAGSSATLKFTYIDENNEVKYYQVKITIKEEVIIKRGENNSALITALQSQSQKIGTIDGEGNLVITQEEIDKVTELNVSGIELATLEELEIFKNLTKLECQNNQLTSIDLTKFPQLTYLDCSKNPLTLLDVSGLTELIELHCDGCFGSTPVSRSYVDGVLDLSECKKLGKISCAQNNLDELILPQTETLTEVICHHNNLKTLDVSFNPALTILNCSNNQLEEINVNKNLQLIELTATDNYLQRVIGLEWKNALRTLDVSRNQIEELNVSLNESLTKLCCGTNKLKFLSVEKNLELIELGCEYNYLLTLNISNNTKLETLSCGSQRNVATGYDEQMTLSINEEQREPWENNWKNICANVVISEDVITGAGNQGNDFINGGVY